jgi:hypothetical protein
VEKKKTHELKMFRTVEPSGEASVGAARDRMGPCGVRASKGKSKIWPGEPSHEAGACGGLCGEPSAGRWLAAKNGEYIEPARMREWPTKHRARAGAGREESPLPRCRLGT